MTLQEFDKLEWQFISHFDTATHHSTVDQCKTIPTLLRFAKVKYKDGKPSNRGGYTHYMLDDIVFKSKQKLLEAMNNENRGTSTEY